MLVKQFHHIWLELPPGREKEAKAFYEGVLGAKEIARPHPFSDTGLWMELSGVQLHFGTEANEDLLDLQKHGRNFSERHFALVVDDAQNARKELQQKNIAIKEGSLIAGMDRFSFRDPFRNKIELFSFDG